MMIIMTSWWRTSRLIRWLFAFGWLCCLGLASAIAAQAPAAAPGAQVKSDAPLVVTGVLKPKSGRALPDGLTVNPMFIERDSKGGLEKVEVWFPGAKPAADGSFSLEIPREKIRDNQEFSLCLNGSPPGLRRGNAMLTFKVQAKTPKISLGDIEIE